MAKQAKKVNDPAIFLKNLAQRGVELNLDQEKILQQLLRSDVFFNLIHHLDKRGLLISQRIMAILSHPDPFSLMRILHKIEKNQLLTGGNFDRALTAEPSILAISLYLLGSGSSLTQNQLDILFETGVIPRSSSTLSQFFPSPKNLIAEKFDRLGIALVYGFDEARVLSNEDGITKFTLNQLNEALGIDYGTINSELISSLKQGIVLDEVKINLFITLTHLDPPIAKKILDSYANFLRDHYDYLSPSACLQRKAQKYLELFFLYALIKNNHCTIEETSAAYPYNLFNIFLTFLYEDDQQGYAIKDEYSLELPKTDQAYLSNALDNLVFRRLSKLGLIWSAHYDLPVHFYVTFTPEEAKNKDAIETYEPITFSEYRLVQKYAAKFMNIKTIAVNASEEISCFTKTI